MALTPATNKQIPDHSFMDHFYKQTYLGNGYSLPLSLSLSDTSEDLFLLIKNPAVTATAFPVQQALFMNLRQLSSSAKGLLLNIYSNPTISTAVTKSTPVNLRPASSNASIALCYPNGQFSVSANGTLISSIRCAGDGTLTVDPNLFVLDPGQNALFTLTAVANTTVANLSLSWFEL